MADLKFRSIRSTCHAPGENLAGLVFPCRWHAAGLDRPENSVSALAAMGDRSYLPKLQTTPGSGRPGQSHAPGGATHLAYGTDTLQPNRGMVPSCRTQKGQVSRPSLLHRQEGIIVRRHVDYVAAGILARKLIASAVRKQTRENASYPPCGFSQA